MSGARMQRHALHSSALTLNYFLKVCSWIGNFALLRFCGHVALRHRSPLLEGHQGVLNAFHPKNVLIC